MHTIAELVGGCADGVQFDPDDPSEPNDWPDVIMIEDKSTGRKRAAQRPNLRAWRKRGRLYATRNVYPCCSIDDFMRSENSCPLTNRTLSNTCNR